MSGGSPSEMSPAAEFIAGNVDLLSEILLRVPAKSLIRFKSVSRHWLSLISHSQFSATHASRNHSPSISGFYVYNWGPLESVSLLGRKNLPSLSFLDGCEGIYCRPTIRKSCNGLLLCKAGIDKYIVCNVVTQKYKLLPSSCLSVCPTYFNDDAYLGFDPLKSSHYKVFVCYKRCDSPWSFEIHMYNSEDGIWKKIIPPVTCRVRSVLWNGAIYMPSQSNENVLLRFDVDAEEMIALPFPSTPGMRSDGSIMYIGESGGCLILIQNSLNPSKGFAILELGSDTSRIVKYWVDCRTMACEFPEMEESFMFDFEVLCVVKGKENGDYTLVLAILEKLVSYNVRCNTFNVLRHLGGDKWRKSIDRCCVFPLLETLSPI